MLLRLSRYEFPSPGDRIFGRSGPLVLEVGFGDGRFIADMARRHPDWNWLGAEVSGTSVVKTLKRLRRSGIHHVRLYHGHASVLVRNLVPPRSLTRVYLNFPDPWPKKRHREKRLLREPFYGLLSTRMTPGGILLLTTDHPDYCQAAVDEARASGYFDVQSGRAPPEVLRTKYALKWREQDKPIYHVVFTKNAEGPTVPPRERFDMPHAILGGELPQVGGFEKIVAPIPEGHVVVLRAYRGLDGESLLFLVQVDEAELSQKILVEARPHTEGIHLGLVRFGDPLVTEGVKAAMGCMVDWFVERGLVLRRRSY